MIRLVSKGRLAATVSGLVLASTAMPVTANAATCNWLVAAGNWATGGNWGCGVQPTSADDAVITGAGAVVSISGITANTGTLNLGSGNALNVNNSLLNINNNAVTNNGTITLGGAAGTADFRNNVAGTLAITGTGSIVLDDTAGAARIYAGSWSFGSGQTVRGSGQIGLNQIVITNAGLISANVNGRNLSVDVSGGSGGTGGGGVGTGGNAGLFNTGTMQAANGGSISF